MPRSTGGSMIDQPNPASHLSVFGLPGLGYTGKGRVGLHFRTVGPITSRFSPRPDGSVRPDGRKLLGAEGA